MEEKYTFEGNRAPLSIKPTLKNSWKIRPSALYRVFFLHKSEDPKARVKLFCTSSVTNATSAPAG
jgi:hypothetical protein